MVLARSEKITFELTDKNLSVQINTRVKLVARS